jgi:hypothetical protein
VLLIVVSVAVFVSAYSHAGHKQAVIAVALPVEAGQQITAQDLTAVQVSPGGGLSTIPASDAGQVVGRRASVVLVPGGLLVPGDLAKGAPPAHGLAIVGVSLGPGQMPADGVFPGESVAVVATAQDGSPYSGTNGSASGLPAPETTNPLGGSPEGLLGTTPGLVIVPDATVVASGPVPSASSGSDTTSVSLQVPAQLAPQVAANSAAKQVALVVEAPAS